ncbi:MAG: hypothetical protein JGK17_10855 [Microcoleus sp. PH2017_10_PVI_O_A]|nr:MULTISPECIES: hypothetical protein [unclassified Microcoleus]MCC3406070.1 hypothetical protein [Microcoleus sp. PH2017_10_PVI_O_A]MCC3460182.1 hypothetical protein [Microcoleus sp. PH2017_11_PCY_U_A]MCC3478605.1 hypothetical protein [Microcoleus sp. PH2017_12_PCY_D_A]MCC3529967.1 hypothetical protein [Microcoleus sp. PH2017_21_RUC_O_A]MCC3542334.1 hypothetical protein [Microcoleus sp. PH2017_22_RUC_O_B]
MAYLPIACTEIDRNSIKIRLHPPEITEPLPEPAIYPSRRKLENTRH